MRNTHNPNETEASEDAENDTQSESDLSFDHGSSEKLNRASLPKTQNSAIPQSNALNTTPNESTSQIDSSPKIPSAVPHISTPNPSSGASTPNIKRVSDFKFGEILGEGSYSTVLTATENSTKREYAIKVLDKRHIIKEKKEKYVNIEKEALCILSKHPGFIKLFYTFQDAHNLYFVLSLARNGELLDYINKLGRFNEICAQYYAALIVDSIDYMHGRGVIHRDLKPENILLDDNMRTKITDFGSAKILNSSHGSHEEDTHNADKPQAHSRSFVGTARYVSPEVLSDKIAGTASDIWAFGCILFQILAGKPPFVAGNEYLTFQSILHLSYEIPPDISDVASDLIKKLLVLDPKDRLTVDEIHQHPFFNGIKFDNTLWELPPPRLKPFGHTSVLSLSVPNASNKHENGDLTSPLGVPSMVSASTNAAPSPVGTFNRGTLLPCQSNLEEENKEWSSILQDDEKISKIGTLNVYSMSGINGNDAFRFFSSLFRKRKPRTFILTNFGRYLCVASDGEGRKTVKEEIPIKSVGMRCRMVKNNEHGWVVETPTKSWSFEDPNGPASAWVELLDKASSISLPFGNHSVTSFSRSIARSAV
ncbi:Serine/threonine-protein kinase ksg1 [Schizosaccharomyces pombe]